MAITRRSRTRFGRGHAEHSTENGGTSRPDFRMTAAPVKPMIGRGAVSTVRSEQAGPMRVFLYEYTCAAAAAKAGAPSLRTEGWAMLAAICEDFARIPGV